MQKKKPEPGRIFPARYDGQCRCFELHEAVGVEPYNSGFCSLNKGEPTLYVKVEGTSYLVDHNCWLYLEDVMGGRLAQHKAAIGPDCSELILEELSGNEITIWEAAKRMAAMNGVCFQQGHTAVLVALGVETKTVLSEPEPQRFADNQEELAELLCPDAVSTYIS